MLNSPANSHTRTSNLDGDLWGKVSIKQYDISYMAKRKTPGNDISAHDILRTEIIVNQELIDVLIAKQVITEEELIGSIQNIKRDHQKLVKGSNKIVPLKR